MLALAGELGAQSRINALFLAAIEKEAYSRATALSLADAARGLGGESWGERRIAILLFENQLLRLPPHDYAEFELLSSTIGFEYAPETIAGLRGRLSRLQRVHGLLQSPEKRELSEWEYLLRCARNECKLTLARYFFGPREVSDRILSQLILTRGSAQITYEDFEAPGYERSILKDLREDGRIYWVSEKCSSELNSLVEYPLTSAVVVIKPPGSDFEIEIKRAGTRGSRLLDVIRTRNGRDAPVSHRLFGGSLGWLAEREIAAAGVFSRIYRIVHGKEAPCSQGAVVSSVVTVPTASGGETHILDYLTDEEQFGQEFAETRAAMNVCATEFPGDTGVARASYEGDAGLTLQFIGQALPKQAILWGSSSFRLDRIAIYLSERGPEEYFTHGLGTGFQLRDVRWLADTVLEEILGIVEPPPEPYVDYAQYVRCAFQVPGNRERADRCCQSVMRQIGECWGTLLAVRGFSDGESFVLRNVGLKSFWDGASWQVRVIFMDHDDLTVAGSRYTYLWPWREVSSMELDQVHILGGPMGGEVIPGEVGALASIYRVSCETAEQGLAGLKEAARSAYQKTQSELDANPALQSIFYPNFIERHRDLDPLIPWLLETDPAEHESWKTQAKAYLINQNCDSELAAEYARTASHFRGHFEQMAFLYRR